MWLYTEVSSSKPAGETFTQCPTLVYVRVGDLYDFGDEMGQKLTLKLYGDKLCFAYIALWFLQCNRTYIVHACMSLDDGISTHAALANSNMYDHDFQPQLSTSDQMSRCDDAG